MSYLACKAWIPLDRAMPGTRNDRRPLGSTTCKRELRRETERERERERERREEREREREREIERERDESRKRDC